MGVSKFWQWLKRTGGSICLLKEKCSVIRQAGPA